MNNHYRHHRKVENAALNSGARCLTGEVLAVELQQARELVGIARRNRNAEALNYWTRRLAHLETVAAQQNG